MKWFMRCFWLAAWGVWLWLGFGLYRELPRELGAKTCTIGVDDSKILGFVGESETIAVNRLSKRASPNDLVLVNGQNGNEISRRPMPNLPPMVMLRVPHAEIRSDSHSVVVKRSPETLRYGILLGNGGAGRRSNPGLYALNVVNGERKQLTTIPVIQIVLHPTEPIVAVVGGEFGGVEDRITVANYQSGHVLFEHPFPKRMSLYARPVFVPSRRLVVLPLLRRLNTVEKPSNQLIQAWTLTSPGELVQEWSGDENSPLMPLSASMTGRMLFQGRFESKTPGATWVDVYDFNDDRYLSTLSAREQPKKNGGVYTYTFDDAPMTIAPRGGAVLRIGRLRRSGPRMPMVKKTSDTLREVGTGRTLWKGSTFESVIDVSATDDSVNGSFLVAEPWQEIWKAWLPNWKYRSFAWRSLDTGELLYRTSDPTRFDPRNINSSRTLVILTDGTVHRWPLRVNWPVLALCQAILALPLVLFWAVLRWRRKRRNRAAVLKSRL